MYGALVKQARLAKGWTRLDLARLYGEFFHDQTISEDTIRMWEDYDKLPKKPKRRQVLALLLDLPLAALGVEELFTVAGSATITPQKINVSQAAVLLQQYKHQNHASTVGSSLGDILGTIHRIHDEIPYASSAEQSQFLYLLADYQQFVAGIFRDRSDYDQALYYQNKAYAVAKSINDSEQLALALWRRGLTYHDQENLAAAISDFEAAQNQKPASLNLQGALWLSLGHVQAHAATDKAAMIVAYQSFKKAEALLDPARNEEDTYFIKFNEESYHLNKASAFLGSPIGQLRSPREAFNELAEVPVNLNRKRRYAYSSYLQAKGWLEDGELPMATQISLDALEAAGEINSVVNIQRIQGLHQTLQATRFGRSPEVAKLGIEVQRLVRPELFA